MEIKFKDLKIQSFKSHTEVTVEFGDETVILGRNGEGKSSTGEAITWVLFNSDTFGTKLDPKPINEPDAVTKVELLLSVDNKDILLVKEQKKTAKYFINDVPKKAKEYESFIAELFDKNVFLSLFNPNYFSSQHWQEQREQLLSYVPEPLNQEVLAELTEIDRNRLEPELKKRSLDDLEKIHKTRKTAHDKTVERAAERVNVLREQFQLNKPNDKTPDEIKGEIDALKAERSMYEQSLQDVQEQQKAYTEMGYKIVGLEQEIEKQRNVLQSIKAEKVQDTCYTCGQSLPDEAQAKVKQDRANRFNATKANGIAISSKLKELKEQYATMEKPKNDFPHIKGIDEQLAALQVELRGFQIQESALVELKQAEEQAETIRKERNESIGFLDAIKEFRGKRSELMVSKVKGLFQTIDIKLFEQLKNGAEQLTFEIMKDGKGYAKLSTAEKIKAGLEVIDAISNQSGLVVPVFVDNAECILKFKTPVGQLILAKVFDCEYRVEKWLEFGEKEGAVNAGL